MYSVSFCSLFDHRFDHLQNVVRFADDAAGSKKQENKQIKN